MHTHIYVYVVCKHLNAKVILCFYPNFAFFISMQQCILYFKDCTSKQFAAVNIRFMGMHVYSLKHFFTNLY